MSPNARRSATTRSSCVGFAPHSDDHAVQPTKLALPAPRAVGPTDPALSRPIDFLFRVHAAGAYAAVRTARYGFAVITTPEGQRWLDRAACRNLHMSVFFDQIDHGPNPISLAARVCCEVRAACLSFALATD